MIFDRILQLNKSVFLHLAFILKMHNMTFVKPKTFMIFTESAPLGRFSYRVAMSVLGSVCLFVPSDAVFFRPLIGSFF